MTTDIETLADLRDKVFRRAVAIRRLTAVEQLNIENDWTGYVKNLVDFGNKYYLRNFSLRLEMDVDDYNTMQSLGGR